jgi:hypothetical protein
MWPFASSSSSSQSLPGHPYFPRTAAIAGGYEANQLSTPTLLSLFSGYCTAILAVGYVFARRYPAKRGLPALSKSDVAAVLWWSLCAGIHTFFEGVSFLLRFYMFRVSRHDLRVRVLRRKT